MTLPRFLTRYYLLGTLGFAAIDWVLAAPVRAAFLGRPTQRITYYAILVGLGLVCSSRPHWAPAIGIAESSVNLLLVLLSIMLPIYGLAGAVESGGAVGLPFTTWTFVNVGITGAVLIYSFHRSQRALLKQMGKKADR